MEQINEPVAAVPAGTAAGTSAAETAAEASAAGSEPAAETAKKTKKKAAAKAAPAVSGEDETPGLVTILYIDSAMPNNQIPIGHGAVLTGSGRVFTKTLAEFQGEFMTGFVQKLIRARKFIILSGLTQEQREMLGCDYQEGEVLKSAGLFEHLLKCGTDRAAEIYTALCKEHREMVCTYLITRKEAGDARVTTALLRALDDISAPDYPGGRTPLSQALNG